MAKLVKGRIHNIFRITIEHKLKEDTSFNTQSDLDMREFVRDMNINYPGENCICVVVLQCDWPLRRLV
jgi:hypothetical protein